MQLRFCDAGSVDAEEGFQAGERPGWGELPMRSLKHVPLETLSTGTSKLGKCAPQSAHISSGEQAITQCIDEPGVEHAYKGVSSSAIVSHCVDCQTSDSDRQLFAVPRRQKSLTTD